MTTHDEAIARVMRIRNGMTLDAEAEAIIRKELDAAYRRGYDKAYNTYVNYREDMGR
jgi:hypothetical protein